MQHRVREAFRIERQRPDWIAGIRLAVITGAPLLFGLLIGQPPVAMMATIGAVNTAVAASGGTVNTRLKTTGLATVTQSLALLVAMSVSGNQYLTVAVLALWLLGWALVAGLGSTTAGTGFVTGVVFILGLGITPPSGQILTWTGMFVGGCLWAVLMTGVLWPILPEKAVHAALATNYRVVGTFLKEMPHSPKNRSQAYDAAAKTLAAGDEVLVDYRRGKRAHSSKATAAAGHQQTATGLQLLLSSLDKSWDDCNEIPPELESLRNVLVDACHELALEVDSGPRFDSARLATALAQAKTAPLTIPAETTRVALVVAAESLLQTSSRLDDPGDSFNLTKTLEWASFPLVGERLRSIMHWDSTILRHALRVAVLAAAAQVLADFDPFGNGYWIPLTVWVVLQPDFGATWNRGLQRVTGTVIGVLIGFGLANFLAGFPFVLTAVIMALTFVIAATIKLNYAIAVTAITATVILLLSIVGGSPELAWVRLGSTLAGAAIAFVGGYLLWPSWQRVSLPRSLRTATHTATAYSMHVVQQDQDRRELRGEHQQAELARSNVEAAVQRSLSEPASMQVDPTVLMQYCGYLRLLVDDTGLLSLDREAGRPEEEIGARTSQIAQDTTAVEMLEGQLLALMAPDQNTDPT